jgi:dephospho-CoA kinase
MKTLFFITSNRVKLMHARHLALQYNVEIHGKKYYGIAYREPRSLNRKELLQKSYEDALKRWVKTAGSPHAFFFIEDTSLIIHALSKSGEYPGVDVKYWMQETDFAELDTKLQRRGNNRRVTVRSDVLLHLPDDFRKENEIPERMVHFIARTQGTITKQEVPIETNLLYPWLDNRSFNKWFVPDGCDVPLSALPIEVADSHDIRRDSIGAMLRFLSDRNAFEDHPEYIGLPVTKFLPHLLPPLLIVTGLPCAGKTTLGMHLSEMCGYYHIEASDFMKRAFYERHGTSSKLLVEDFAEQVLRRTPDIVVAPVLAEIERSEEDFVIITGFRSPKEIEIFQRDYRGPAEVQCWYIEANQNIRYERSVARARHDAAESIGNFRKRDKVQLGMGLDTIRHLLRGSMVRNEHTIPDYLNRCLNQLNLTPTKFRWPTVQELRERPTSLEEAILIGLAVRNRKSDAELSTTQIAHELNKVFSDADFETNKNNVSRYFNFRPHPFYRAVKVKGVLKYSLSPTGLSRALRLVSSRWSPAGSNE